MVDTLTRGFVDSVTRGLVIREWVEDVDTGCEMRDNGYKLIGDSLIR
jgi:hypothetical protein